MMQETIFAEARVLITENGIRISEMSFDTVQATPTIFFFILKLLVFFSVIAVHIHIWFNCINYTSFKINLFHITLCVMFSWSQIVCFNPTFPTIFITISIFTILITTMLIIHTYHISVRCWLIKAPVTNWCIWCAMVVDVLPIFSFDYFSDVGLFLNLLSYLGFLNNVCANIFWFFNSDCLY